jgi:hypothetical protein
MTAMFVMEPTVDVFGPRSTARRNKSVRARLSKVASARDTIEGFDRDHDLLGLTYGQFSLLDLIDATLELTGPADVVISTWSAGFYDVEEAVRWRDSGRMLSTRFVMDSSDKRRQSTPGDVAELFGAENVRTFRSHAKFVLISNDSGWRICITTSMNLNLNPRLEQFEMTDDVHRFDFMMAFVDACFAELSEGDTQDRTLPGLPELVSVQPKVGIQMGPAIAFGLWDQ